MARYRLKTMVLGRMLAEMSVCVLLMALPTVMYFSHSLATYPASVRAMLIALAVLGALALPWFGFIVWRVTTDEVGLTTYSFFKTQTMPWAQIKNMTRRSTWSFVRYVVEFENGELAFPVLLNKCEELIAEISSHLPASSGRLRSSHRTFLYDRLAMLVQLSQSLLAIVFVCIFWFFFAARSHLHASAVDNIILLVFCGAITLIFVWRCFMIITMPKNVETTRPNLIVRTIFGESVIPWTEIKSVGEPIPLLPEGFMINTKSRTILVGTGMESGDELLSFIKMRIENPNAPPADFVDVEDAVNLLNVAEITRRIEAQISLSQEMLQSLSQQNVALDQECAIDHCFYATTHEAITGLGQNLADQGFEVDIFAPIAAENVNIEYWTMRMRINQSPQDAGSDRSAAFLMGVADEFFCVYDGWSPNLSQVDLKPL